MPPRPEHTPVPVPLDGPGQLFGLLQQVALAMQVPPQLYVPLGQAQASPGAAQVMPPEQFALVQQLPFGIQPLPHAV